MKNYLFAVIILALMGLFSGCPNVNGPETIEYQDPVALDSDVVLSSQLSSGGAMSYIPKAAGDLVTPTKVTARGSDISFYNISGVDFNVAETMAGQVEVSLGVGGVEIEEALVWKSDGTKHKTLALRPEYFRLPFTIWW